MTDSYFAQSQFNIQQQVYQLPANYASLKPENPANQTSRALNEANFFLSGYEANQLKYANQLSALKDQINRLQRTEANSKGTTKMNAQKSLSAKKRKYAQVANKQKQLQNHKSKTQKANWYRKNRINTKRNMKKHNHHKNAGKLATLTPNNPFTGSSYVYMFVTEEAPEYSTNVTTVPVENGINKTTTTQKQATTVSITGIISSDIAGEDDSLDLSDVKDAVDRIAYWCDYGSSMQYSGTNHYDECIISDFSPDYNLGSDGSINSASFTLTLTLTDYFNSTDTKKTKKAKHSGTKTAKRGKNKKGNKFVVVKAGDTYNSIHRKVDIPISTLRTKNSYADREIPIGSKIYY